MSVRLHELAKDLKLTSKELMGKLKTLKVTAKSHMSVLDEETVKRVKELVSPPSKAKASVKSGQASSAKPSETPSIASVKQAFLQQRIGASKSPATMETKRPSVSSNILSQTAVIPKIKKVQSGLPAREGSKAAAEAKKTHKPAAEATVAASQEPAVFTAAEIRQPKKIEIATPITVKDLAAQLFLKPSDLIQRLIKLNIFATMNQAVNFDIVSKIAAEVGFELQKPQVPAEAAAEAVEEIRDKSLRIPRAPIVTLMGHVDHGKTSLLDAIRKTKVAAGEAGGITQHIGAYEVFLPKGAVTFLDTPGHEAFTAMRARGAKLTDVVVLVVAADDGVMPQTIEAIDHAKAADVTIIVAINKIDLPSANPDRVKKALMEHGLMSEDWGGKTIMLAVSAKTGKGIDELLDMLVLESELLELKANPKASARGVVVEAELSKESGVLATVLIQDGTLRIGDAAIVGDTYCKVRAMINDRGQRIKEALPSMPVEILGLPGVPKAGDHFYVVKDERTAKEICDQKKESTKQSSGAHITLEHLYEDIKAGKVQELKLIIKSDVQGSVEALRATLAKIQSTNVRFNIIHSGIGDVTESDVMLAAASDAVVIGFHVDIVGTAKELADKELVDVRFYEIIYEVKTAIEKAMEGLLQPELKEVFIGEAEVRQVFKVSKIGSIAGSIVQKGKIVRNFPCRVVRSGAKVHEGKVESLKRFKDDAREVLEGFECGIGVSNFDDILAGDRIEVYEVQKKARKLE